VPACGEQNPEGSRYCSACGTALTVEPAVEERKIVWVLFVDLVDFTSRSDQADPEDVRAMLVPYHTRVKSEIESFGGVVEKFIGGAVSRVRRPGLSWRRRRAGRAGRPPGARRDPGAEQGESRPRCASTRWPMAGA
jgi:class 3 adenylate cyclase